MKRRLLSGGLVILALFSSLNASPSDEEIIRSVVAAFPVAWNRHDVKALAGLWTPTGDLMNLSGITARGRSEVERLLQRDHGTLMRATTLSWTPTSLRIEKPDLAVVDLDSVLTGMRRIPNPYDKNENGPQAARPLKHRVTVVLMKTDGIWSFAVLRFIQPMDLSFYVP